MKSTQQFLPAALLSLAMTLASSFAQTDGAAKFQGAILDYDGSGTRHWAVGWVTRQDGTFIKSLRKQGPTWTTTHWDSHCRVWNTARGGSATGSQALDGYSSATAADYTGTNSPVIWTWNCRDANGTLPNGTQSFSIAVSTVPVSVASVVVEGTSLVMSGTGPANGVFSVLISTDANQPAAQWTPIATGSLDSAGKFSYSATPDFGVTQRFYRLRLP